MEALVLIDLQTWVVDRFAPDGGPGAARAAAAAAAAFRRAGSPVVHVRHLPPDGADDPGAAFVVPVPADEPVVTKDRVSAFDGTRLDALLRGLGVDTVVLAGLVTEGGVRGAADDAVRLGFDVAVLLPAVAGHTAAGHEDALAELEKLGVRRRPL